MFERTRMTVLLTSFLLLTACGDDADKSSNAGNINNGGGGGGTITDRGGPDSLTGFAWTMDPVEVNGVQLQLAFEFTEDSIIASNTCNGVTTVTTSSPLRYTYSATIPEANSDRVESGENFCEIEIFASEFDFEIVGDNLQITQEGETLVAQPDGATSGLYGDWFVDTEVGKLTFSMGNGRLAAENACINGLTASTSVSANYRNFVVIESASEGGDESCSVSIAQGTFEYRFDGDDLILIFEGEETVFSR